MKDDNTIEKKPMALDDEQRVKVMSPSMLVIRRFIRNKLAITGLGILIFMFIFSFVGGIIIPYAENQVFYYYGDMSKEYASATKNQDLRYTVAEGKEFSSLAQPKFILAITTGKSEFEAKGEKYTIETLGADFYKISQLQVIAEVPAVAGAGSGAEHIEYLSGFPADIDKAEFTSLYTEAVNSGESSFESGGVTYHIARSGKVYNIMTSIDIAVASMQIFDSADKSGVLDYNFKLNAELTLVNGGDGASFTVDGKTFEIDTEDNISTIYLVENGIKTEYANMSDFVVKPISADQYLSVGYKAAVKQAAESGVKEFYYTNPETGEEQEYSISRLNNQFTIKAVKETMLISMYEYPSAKHWLGTDANGMDLLTRLMYGGRISLTIGFVVVALELLLGVILGGISGYFSGWIDTLIMRIVDIINCIPSYPIYLIVGQVMDSLKVDPKIRIYYMMVVIAVLGWTGIARLVRGQILTLREQEFMIAAEATGIRVSRRIYRHLVPNIIPQLIVIATMSLGGIILTEATLSFLGLGVKFPYASWGNIISAVSDSHVMVNYLFVWIPAGLLILLTVLGFNFVGDGLRDAFDPKMKR